MHPTKNNMDVDVDVDVERYYQICWGIQENTSPSKRRSLTAFPKCIFQAQEIREYRKSGTCEASSSQMCGIRETWFGEETEPRACGSPESQLFATRISEVFRFGNPVKTPFETQALGRARTCGEAKATSEIC
jgi:hypothetical protein